MKQIQPPGIRQCGRPGTIDEPTGFKSNTTTTWLNLFRLYAQITLSHCTAEKLKHHSSLSSYLLIFPVRAAHVGPPEYTESIMEMARHQWDSEKMCKRYA
ncbi:hypothetical protein BIW11_09320, partial [Tropilaelaps mercedesae]